MSTWTPFQLEKNALFLVYLLKNMFNLHLQFIPGAYGAEKCDFHLHCLGTLVRFVDLQFGSM